MKAEIITISSQLLRGQTLNPGVPFITRELISLGISVQQSVLLRDNADDLKRALKMEKKRSDLIVIIGDLDQDKNETGFLHQNKGIASVSLPESFDKLKAIFLESTRPLIIKNLLNDAVIETQVYSLYGLTLTQIHEQLSHLITDVGNPFVGIYDEEDEVEIQITAKADSVKEAKAMLRVVTKEVKNRVANIFLTKMENG